MAEITIHETLPGSIHSRKEVEGDMIHVRRSADRLTSIRLPNKTGEYQTDVGTVRLDMKNIRTDEEIREALDKHIEAQKHLPLEQQKRFHWTNKLILESELIGEGEREVELSDSGSATLYESEEKRIEIFVSKTMRKKTSYQIYTETYSPNSTTLWR